ncbi:MAG: bifunctional phosphoribosylaminoimidazolecarboxamide formyltransferase/IMP cyclohydrolase [Buchnera aphidicola (Chaetogeoica yunlongensis)]
MIQNTKQIKNALISISNTTGIIDFAKSLVSKNIKLFATSGTAKLLKKNNINVIKIAHYTQCPEIMNSRIKTLHHKIYASILAQPEKDKKIIKKNNIILMDMIIVNFYPFSTNLQNKNLIFKNAMENIDIGGPSMVRAAAKNYKNVLVIVKPKLYSFIVQEMTKNNNIITNKTKLNFATIALKYVMHYDEKIYHYFKKKNNTTSINPFQKTLPTHLTLQLIKKQDLYYGENKLEQAAWYTTDQNKNYGKLNIQQLQGKTLSYNNLLDIYSSLSCIQEFKEFTCVILKHGNPCGISTSSNNYNAYLLAYETDPISAFGGTIAFNTILDEKTTQTILEKQFLEIILAPEFTHEAKKALNKKPNLRVIQYLKNYNYSYYHIDIKSIYGDFLIQNNIQNTIKTKKWKIVSKKIPTLKEIHDAKFALKVVKHLKSNAVVFVKNKTTITIGSGQTSRIDAIKIAINKTNNSLSLKNTILASDAFFPFKDSIELISNKKISCIIQPGGSIQDKKIIHSVNQHKISMIFTKSRYFKH